MKASEFTTEAVRQRLDPKCWKGKHKEGTKIKGGVRVNNCVPNESVTEGHSDQQRKVFKKNGEPVGEVGIDRESSPGNGQYYMKHYASGRDLAGYDSFEEAVAELKHCIKQGVAEEYNGNVKDTELKNVDPDNHSRGEGEFVKNQLHTMKRVITHLDNAIGRGEDLPDWVQSEIAQAVDKIVGVMDYSISSKEQDIEKHHSGSALMKEQGVAEGSELSEEFDLIESVIDNLALHNGVDAEAIWEDLENLTDDELYVFATTTTVMETEAWQKANKRDKTDGMSRKAVKTYRREHPGSKLQTAVTTKPGKLKKGSKASKRRKSYCSRSRGQMKMHNISCAKTPDKAICKARRRWNC